MALAEEPNDSTEVQNSEDLFVWDESTQLFFHASSGFYHDPNAGWYYSSRDGLYYKFENGNYVLMESHKDSERETIPGDGTVADNPVQEEQCKEVQCKSYINCSSQFDECDAYKCIESGADGSTQGHTEGASNQTPEISRPPSEWLEETLIDLYLSGYDQAVNSATVETATPCLEAEVKDNIEASLDGNNDPLELEEGEWIPEEGLSLAQSAEEDLEEGEWVPEDDHDLSHSSVSWDEENWLAQFGQVTQPEEEPQLGFPVVDLWDWSIVRECRKDAKDLVSRLVGRLMRRSVKLHPSMPSGGRLLKTAPICEVRFDLVRVKTGKVYKLRCPSAKYLASLSSYDSSNPTKDWGFPELSVQKPMLLHSKSTGESNLELSQSSSLPGPLSASQKKKGRQYRDRAAERRTLHGGFGVGPGQKEDKVGDGGESSSAPSSEEAAAEALKMTFGAGSYARKILKNMGWKEGEALGSSTKGLVEPLEAVGNIGNAGLGFPQGQRRTKRP